MSVHPKDYYLIWSTMWCAEGYLLGGTMCHPSMTSKNNIKMQIFSFLMDMNDILYLKRPKLSMLTFSIWKFLYMWPWEDGVFSMVRKEQPESGPFISICKNRGSLSPSIYICRPVQLFLVSEIPDFTSFLYSLYFLWKTIVEN